MQVIYSYIRKNLSGKKGQSGFTLIELLVVVTILGILAGIVTLSLVGLTSNAQTKSCLQEYKTVQAALDAYMAANNLDSLTAAQIPASATGTSDMTNPIVLYRDGTTNPIDASHPTYVRNTPTQWSYAWDAAGRITFIRSGPAGSVPSNCVTSG